MTFLSVIIGLLILVILVVLHEFGHAYAAKKSGVVVEEFGVGFPPKAWGKKIKNGVFFTVNWLPLGGFVKLQGEHDSANKKGDYGAASFWAKTKILFAGVAMNWLVSIVILGIMAATVGLPKIVPNQYVGWGGSQASGNVIASRVVAGSPAQKAGIQGGDAILKIDGQQMFETQQVTDFAKQNAGKKVTISYLREKVAYQQSIELGKKPDGTGYLGVAMTQDQQIKWQLWGAPFAGVATTAQLSWETLKGTGSLVASLASGVTDLFSADGNIRASGGSKISAAGDSVAGPVGIVSNVVPSAVSAGPQAIMLLMAIISLTLAVMNVLPIPALDGGRWFTMVLFRVFKKPLTKEIEERINSAGFAVLMALIMVVTIADVSKIL